MVEDLRYCQGHQTLIIFVLCVLCSVIVIIFIVEEEEDVTNDE